MEALTFGLNWNLEVLVFLLRREENRRTRIKALGARRESTTNSILMIRTRVREVELGRAIIHCANHAPPIKKTNKRLHFIVLLSRANVLSGDIVAFYCTTIRAVLQHCAPVYHLALPQYLSDDIERVRSMIFSSRLSYSECLAKFGVDALLARQVTLCSKLFSSIMSRPSSVSIDLSVRWLAGWLSLTGWLTHAGWLVGSRSLALAGWLAGFCSLVG